MTEDKMAEWHQQLNGYEFEQASGVGEGQGGLCAVVVCGVPDSDTTKRLNTNWMYRTVSVPLHFLLSNSGL